MEGGGGKEGEGGEGLEALFLWGVCARAWQEVYVLWVGGGGGGEAVEVNRDTEEQLNRQVQMKMFAGQVSDQNIKFSLC